MIKHHEYLRQLCRAAASVLGLATALVLVAAVPLPLPARAVVSSTGSGGVDSKIVWARHRASLGTGFAVLLEQDTLRPLSLSEVTKRPRVTNALQVQHRLLQQLDSANLRMRNAEEVTVEVVVGPTGTVAKARLIRSTPAEIGAVVLEAARGLRFEPAERHGRPVAVVVRIPISISVTESGPPPQVQGGIRNRF